ncbi:hypothetical protein FRC11_010362 [Ceratobasidium sp. 423]|nr:hypothetical protein FRC11_010362 [Ceratobasidium sp. 423]
MCQSGVQLEDPLHWGPSSEQYGISQAGTPIRIGDFLNEHAGDPAIKNFIPRLQAHVLDRVGTSGTCSVGIDEKSSANFVNGKFYQHNLPRIHYTTYEMDRAREIINPKACRRFALIRNTDGAIRHPFWYARILAVLHVNVEITNPTHNHPVCQPSRQIDILWVRWLGGIRWGGWNQNRLDQVGYIKDDGDGNGFGFVDPAAVIRGCFLIPAFEYGHTKDLLEKSCTWDNTDDGDWAAYWVMRFVDRDMGMRYFGGGIGHIEAPLFEDSPELEASAEEEIDTIPAGVLANPYAPPEVENESDDDEDNEAYD